MKKRLFLALLVVILFSLMSGCGNDEDLETDDVVKTWRVTKSTGLYDGIDPDSEMLRSLPVGIKLKDTREGDTLSCLTNSEGMELCRVEVVVTGEKGYVLRKWID